jgi:hypothetical protein
MHFASKQNKWHFLNTAKIVKTLPQSTSILPSQWSLRYKNTKQLDNKWKLTVNNKIKITNKN